MRVANLTRVLLAAAWLLGAPCVGLAQSASAIPMQDNQAAAADARVPKQPLAWSSLDAEQQRLLQPLQGQWSQMRPERQHRLAERARRWATLPPQRQQQIHQRLTRWAAMTPEQRRAWRENARAFHDLTPAERARVREAFQRFRALPPEQREALREKWRSINPQQRKQWLQSGQPAPHRPRGH